MVSQKRQIIIAKKFTKNVRQSLAQGGLSSGPSNSDEHGDIVDMDIDVIDPGISLHEVIRHRHEHRGKFWHSSKYHQR